MIQFSRKFFCFAIALLPLFACALPNFAALAPTPEPAEPTATASPTLEIEVDQPFSDQAPERPVAPASISSLPQQPSETNIESSTPVDMVIDVPYQVNRSAFFNHEPPVGQSIIFHATNGARLYLERADQSQIDDVIYLETDAKNYALVPLPGDGDQYAVSVELEGETAVATVGPFFGSPPERVWIPSEIVAGDVARFEFDATQNRPVLVEIRPSVAFDGVLEIYDADGVLVSVDEGGPGENEVMIYTPEFTGRHTFVVLGFQGSSGLFELSTTEFP